MLTTEQLREKCPAAFAEMPASKVSKEYQFVPTNKVISLLEDNNWVPIAAKQQKTRNPDNMEGTKHTLMLRNRSIAAANPTLGGTLPTLRIINSHDWSSRFQILFGMLRIVCGNGLFFAGANFVAFDVRHDRITEDLTTILSRFNSSATRMQNVVEQWAGIELSPDQQKELAVFATSVRFGPDFAGDVSRVSEEMNYARRTEDMGNDLWRTFNRIQENAIKGGFKAGKRRSRTVGNIAAEKNINELLFERANTMALSFT